ncbi:aldehyde dehydrogenase family protein [Caballeronia sp. LZ029]|uniref:aldehyde dehydrogenase family protein n=1 Tax=Caballeronia sp. LZ029 TaxID=3038564 RepID=UPI0028575E2F|nr:aldehyde dehydrogenase family protein [Caballeronia sp. LZ029]MDR5749012.1 aldehyde dehydrogenase family protein [Caballeronia sp. LZ029]
MNQYRNLINGEWVAGEHWRPNVSPSDSNDVIGEYADANVLQIEIAAVAAREAFCSWSKSGPQERFDLLDQTASIILSRKAELATLLSREEGKTLSEAAAEVQRAGQIFKFFAGEALRTDGELLPSIRSGLTVEVTREPIGVVGLITPWNFPIAIPAWKIAPALAYGNCVMIKPAELVPGCAWELVKILFDAGAPPGVVNLLMGPGAAVGEALVRSSNVDAISFTGSAMTGQAVAEKCVSSGKKVQLEMGGKNPMVVLDDADMDVAVEACINGSFYSTGQRCTASSRLIVGSGIHDEFVEAMHARMSVLKVGNPLDSQTQIGPVVDARQLAQDEHYIRLAKREGGSVFGGARVDADTEGFFLTPALVTGTHPSMTINQEEVFGPVASVIRVNDYDEALAVANDTRFGLSAGICTTSLKYASHFKRNVEAGMVMINTPTAGVDYHVPFGGRKKSSYGAREQGSYAQEFFTTVKTAYIAAGIG